MPVNLGAHLEVADVLTAVHCLHECVSLQRLHIVECDRDAACFYWKYLKPPVLRVEQHGAEAAQSRSRCPCQLGPEVNLNPHMRSRSYKYYRAPGALNLVIEVVLAAGCNTEDEKSPIAPFSILNQEGDEAVVLHLAHLGAAWLLDWTLRNNDGLHAEHPRLMSPMVI